MVKQKENKRSVITFSDIFLLISKNLKLLMFFSLFMSFVTYVYSAFFLQPLFISESKIKSLGQNDNSKFSNIASQFGVSLPAQGGDDSWVYEDIIKSRKIARQVVHEKFQTIKYENEKTLISILFNGLDEVNKLEHEIKAVKKFINTIKVKEDKNSNIFTISITSFEPKLAKDINNILINKLHANQKSFNKTTLNDSRKFIENRIDEIIVELKTAEENLRDFTSRNRRIDNSPLLQLDNQRLSREVEVLKQIYITLKQQLELVKIEEVKDANLIAIIDSPNLPLNPDFPKTLNYTIITFILGFSLCLLFLILKDLYEDLSKLEKAKLTEAKIEIKRLFKI